MTTTQTYLATDRKKETSVRLRRIGGQISGLQKMLDENRCCTEILNQIVSVEKALIGAKKVVLRNYLETCATKAIRSANKKKTEEIYTELLNIACKH